MVDFEEFLCIVLNLVIEASNLYENMELAD